MTRAAGMAAATAPLALPMMRDEPGPSLLQAGSVALLSCVMLLARRAARRAGR